ncbi:hypothetical protein E2C01_064608 [Portunus trituberculatus]|uniref:Uncharacterized protein n=1 Tax=Portunus trituberculatus TaxID=210409 RepID=A0A5B7HJL3_PORTR|nr:hypothetical protein [Portunus trituberculatus]
MKKGYDIMRLWRRGYLIKGEIEIGKEVTCSVEAESNAVQCTTVNSECYLHFNVVFPHVLSLAFFFPLATPTPFALCFGLAGPEGVQTKHPHNSQCCFGLPFSLSIHPPTPQFSHSVPPSHV